MYRTHSKRGLQLEGVDDFGVVADFADEAAHATLFARVDVLRGEAHDALQTRRELARHHLQQVLQTTSQTFCVSTTHLRTFISQF